VQLREKDLAAAHLVSLAARLRELTGRYAAALLVNDRIDVALAVGADGVHLGRESVAPAVARRLLGPRRLIGVSTHCEREAIGARRGGADFVVFGPVYSTPSKVAYGPPRGPSELARVAASAGLPVLAIGGITAARVPEVRASGAAGVAVIGAVIAADDPAASTRDLCRALRSPLDREDLSAVRKLG